MGIESQRKENALNTDIAIIGTGPIGEKADQLIAKTPFLRSIGFHTPRRTVLAQGFFDNFFQRNGLGNDLESVQADETTQTRIRKGSFIFPQFDILQNVSQSYGQSPLVIRSSAEGDARGTGTYKSVFSENKTGQFRKGLQKVLASYFSPDAVAFRRDANTGEGFGIMIEPIIGQELEGWITPILSGFGYTSTSRGEGFITIVPGLGCAVESRDGERIMRSQIEQYGGSLSDYIYGEKDAMFHGWKAIKSSALLRTDGHFGLNDYYSAKAFIPSNRYQKAEVANTSIDFPEDIKRAIYDLNLLPFFKNMDKMEKQFGRPQYFEWAMTIEQGKPVYWIIQIADRNKKLDVMDFGNFGTVLFMGHTVTGTGIKESSIIANCWNPDDVERLHRFNKDNKDYVLVFSSRMTSRGGARTQLSYSDFSNASVFLEIQDVQHTGDPVAHLGGQLDMTGKLFGVLDYDAEVPPNWDLYHNGEERRPDELSIFRGKIKTIASERQNKMVVYIEAETK